MFEKKYSVHDIIQMDAIATMKKNIKVLGQKRTLEIINGDGLVLSEESRKVYKGIYFQALHELEG